MNGGRFSTFLRKVKMKLGRDFWLVIKIIQAIIKALSAVFNNENEDDNEHNGE